MEKQLFRRIASLLLLLGFVVVASCGPKQTPTTAVSSAPQALLVSAASSLTEAMNEIGKAYTREHSDTVVRFNFAASGPLEQQIEQGAPVDVFASASPKEIDALEKGKFLEPGTRVDFAGNKLVLIARQGSPVKGWDNLKSPACHRIALSNPDSVPSGRYAKETLTKRGLWSVVKPKAVFGENVRQTLSYVVNGDVDAGIVFATDAIQAKKQAVMVAEAVSGTDHKPIIYPAAVIAKAPNKNAARQFVAFLKSRTAQAVLMKYGFTKLK